MVDNKHINRIFIDFEMHPVDKKLAKGKYRAKEEIIQFGAVVLDGNCVELGSFMSYVKPMYSTEMDPIIAELTHISFYDLEQAPVFSDVMTAFIAWCKSYGQYEIYAWSDSDLNQLRKEVNNKLGDGNADFEYMVNHWFDFQKEYGYMLGLEHATSLKNALDMLAIEPEGRLHDALFDARNTSKLYECTCNADDNTHITTIRKVLHGGDDDAVTLGDLFDFSRWGDKSVG